MEVLLEMSIMLRADSSDWWSKKSIIVEAQYGLYACWPRSLDFPNFPKMDAEIDVSVYIIQPNSQAINKRTSLVFRVNQPFLPFW